MYVKVEDSLKISDKNIVDELLIPENSPTIFVDSRSNPHLSKEQLAAILRSHKENEDLPSENESESEDGESVAVVELGESADGK